MKIKQTAAGLMAGILMLGTLSTPCFAYAPDAESTEESQAAQVEEDTASDNSVSLTPDGNLTLVDDIGSSTEAGQQFITLVTKSGNYFYLIIDRNDKGEETVHFLNQVDEADLFALMDEEQLEALRESQDAGSTENEEPEPTPAAPAETEAPEEQEAQKAEVKPMNMLPIAGVLLALMACGGGYIMLQAKKKKASAQRPDPDADYTEEDEEEYAIPEEDESDPIGDERGYDTEPEDSKE